MWRGVRKPVHLCQRVGQAQFRRSGFRIDLDRCAVIRLRFVRLSRCQQSFSQIVIRPELFRLLSCCGRQMGDRIAALLQTQQANPHVQLGLIQLVLQIERFLVFVDRLRIFP